MKATITVEMNNAAFELPAGSELARILRELASKIDESNLEGEDRIWKLRDINGNNVGQLKVTGKSNG